MPERRQFLKTTGIAAAVLASAGCNSGPGNETPDNQNGTDGNNTTDQGETPGVFDVDLNVFEERMGQEVEVTQLSLFQTANNVGLRFVLTNNSGGVLTDVTVHAQLLNQSDDVIGDFGAKLEQESIDDLAQNEEWHGDIVFEGVGASEFQRDADVVRFWATAQAESQ